MNHKQRNRTMSDNTDAACLSAEAENAESQWWLGECYLYGINGVVKDKTAAVEWFRRSAKQGFAPAQCCLGRCLHMGLGVQRDLLEAEQWLLKAANAGNAEAQYIIGTMYMHGTGTLVSDENKDETAIEWIGKSADQGYPFAQYLLGTFYLRKDTLDTVNRLHYQKRLPRREVAPANAWTKSAARHDAMQWFLKAAKQGHVGARGAISEIQTKPVRIPTANNLCRRAENNISDEDLSGKALKNYLLAAKKGSVDAMVTLGDYYSNNEDSELFQLDKDQGTDCEPDYVMAANWYRQAMKHGADYVSDCLADVCLKVGKQYQDMGGSDANEEYYRQLAKKYYKEAAKHGIADAKFAIGEIEWQMNGGVLSGRVKKQFKTMNVEQAVFMGDRHLSEGYKADDKYSDPSIAKNCFMKALLYYHLAEKMGNNSVKERIGTCYFNMGNSCDNDIDAEQHYLAAAKYGEANAMYILGEIYDEQQDKKRSVYWFRRAIASHNLEEPEDQINSMFRIGKAYDCNGGGINIDRARAMKWYFRAAKLEAKYNGERGTSAHYAIGEAYYYGESIDPNYTEAIRWLRKAAEWGNRDAMYLTGIMYKEGKGVSADYIEAQIWFLDAKKSGDTRSHSLIEEIESITRNNNQQNGGNHD